MDSNGQVPWLVSVISATWEVAIRRFMVQGQPSQKVSETPIQQMSQMWWCILVILVTQKA
jgi:hypothetical protein